MNCKHCNAPLEEGVSVCPACGTENQKTVVWKRILAAVCGVLLLGTVVCAVLYGLGVLDFAERENDLQYKKSYTVSNQAAKRKGTVVVATVNSQELTNEELQIYYCIEVLEYVSTYGDYLTELGLDVKKPLHKQYYDEKTKLTWQQLFLGKALSKWYTYAMLNEQAQIEHYETGEQMQKLLQNMSKNLEDMAKNYGYSSAQEMVETDFGGACTAQAYMRTMAEYYTAMDYFDYKYLLLTPTQEEISAFFEENKDALTASGIKKDSGKYVDVRHILITPVGGKTEGDTTIYSEAEWEACRASAQALLDRWLGEGGSEESFAQLAKTNSQDPGSASNGGLYTQVTKGKMVEAFDNWIFDESRQKGNYGLVKTEFGYHIMYFVSSEDIWVSQVRDQMLTEHMELFISQIKERLPMQVNYKNIVLGNVTLN